VTAVITAKVKAALVNKNREVKALAVKVDTHDGIVLLSALSTTSNRHFVRMRSQAVDPAVQEREIKTWSVKS